MNLNETTAVAVISDDRLMCDGVLRLLADFEDCTATGFTDAFVEPVVLGRFGIAILDARMDGALDTCRALTTSGALPVIFIGAPRDDAWAVDALRAGARGILTQDARLKDLRHAVRVVEDGDVWVRRQWLHAWLRASAVARPEGYHLDGVRARLDARLSRREREVSQCAATGASNREIAQRLGISEATVKVHLSRVFKKLGLTGRAGLAAAYYGVPDPDVRAEPVGRRAS